MSLALLDRMEGNWGGAERLLARSLEIYRQSGSPLSVVSTTINLGIQRLVMGRLRFAADTLSEAVTLASELGVVESEIRARISRAVALIRSGEVYAARVDLAKALRGSRRTGVPRSLALANEFTGELHLACGRPRHARRALERALRIALAIAPEGDIIPEALRRLAETELAEGNPKAAALTAADAAARAERGHDPYEQAASLRVLGQARIVAGDAILARAELLRALEIFHSLDETFESAKVRTLLARLMLSSDAPLEPGEPAGANFDRSGTGVVGPDAGWAAQAAPDFRFANGLTKPPALHSAWTEQGLVTQSPMVLQVLREAEALAASGCSVLILGETGTGKELVARGLHTLSRRAGPFVVFNCAALPAGLAESELFGAERGAFTGAERARRGLLREAAGGTLFLDEIGDLRLESQGALLRFLDTGEVRALGSGALRRVECGIIAATLRPLAEQAHVGLFRRDLYFRLAQGIVVLPPLRERLEDLVPLTSALWARIQPGRPFPSWLARPACLEILRQHPWPGNVRELLHVLRRLAALGGGPLSESRLRSLLLSLPGSAEGSAAPARIDSAASRGFTREEVRDALRRAGGSRKAASRELGIGRSTLYRMMRSLGLG
jgi:transcriptional regulator with AAA-type ATPase domain